MSWRITPSNLLVDDPDAITYLAAVEAVDQQALESGVRLAVNAFVKGCKADGIWPAIKASCILAGARTLAGAVVPLVGTAPTNNNFVAGDYNRNNGIAGNGSTKYLATNRNNTADPQNNRHLSVWISVAASTQPFGGDIGAYSAASSGNSYIGRNSASSMASASSAIVTSGIGPSTATGFKGVSRSDAAFFIYRQSGSSSQVTSSSVAPHSGTIDVFRGGVASLESNARIAFYSIGESLNLFLLDARVTDLINAIGAAIP